LEGRALTAAPFIPMTPADPLKTAFLDANDWGNAQRLVAIAMGHLCWIRELDAFAWYDGKRWSVEMGAIEAQRLAHRVVAHIDEEVRRLSEIADDAVKLSEALGWSCTPEIAQARVDALRKHAVRSGDAGKTAGMLKQVRSMMAVSIDDFDRDPLAYNVQNGTLRFAEGKKGWEVRFSPHDPLDMMMQVANVEYDSAAKCPFWIERLAMLTPDPQQLAAFRLLYGYTLTGLTSDQAFYVHQGKGGDGKSVTHMVLAGLHGDYYRHAGIKTFLQGKDGSGSEHRSDLVRLRGDVRFVTCDEPKARSVWDGEILKQWTGGFVTARGAHERTEVTFKPRGKLFVECNIIPRAPSDDKGFRRRFKLYQWQVSLDDTPAGAMPIDLVLAKLEAEKPGILNWLISGALEWLATRTIPQPDAMAAVLSDFWADSSPLLEWMADRCDTSDPEARYAAKALYQDFKEWCEAQGIEQVMTNSAFGRALRDKQFPAVKDPRTGNRFRKGIQLKRVSGLADPPAPPPSPPAAGSMPPKALDAPGPSDGSDDDGFDPFGDDE